MFGLVLPPVNLFPTPPVVVMEEPLQLTRILAMVYLVCLWSILDSLFVYLHLPQSGSKVFHDIDQNPFLPHLLASASSDKHVRMWDTRQAGMCSWVLGSWQLIGPGGHVC